MLTPGDVAYITANFVPLDEACGRSGEDPTTVRSHIEAGHLPRPTYVLDDGTEMVPADYFSLVQDAKSVGALREHFLGRFSAAAALEPERRDSPEEEWQAYLSGQYGACLNEVTPENIARKSALVGRIEKLLAEPQSENPTWCERLRDAVDELDSLERPFAAYDRVRFGGPSSRDRLITAVRNEFPSIFERTTA